MDFAVKPVLLQTATPSWRTLLILGRVSNLPSVWTNATLGYALGHLAANDSLPGWGAALTLIPFLLGCSLLYVFGMFANDWMDAEWDQKNDKPRPIPQGMISRPNVGFFALFLLFLGLSTTWQAGIWTVGLVSAIVVYTLIHKKTALGIIPMAACRFFLVLMGAAIAGPELPWLTATSLALYLLALTWIARNEHRFGKMKLVGWLLAGICLHDAVWAAVLLNLNWVFAFVAAFALSRVLQKTIPAT